MRLRNYCVIAILIVTPQLHANPISIWVPLLPSGYGATGSYAAVFVGQGHRWTFTVKGRPDGNPNKGALNFIDFNLYSSTSNPLTLMVGGATGHNTSDGGRYTDTSEWERQPSGKDFWGTEWLSASSGKYVSPWGGNQFVGSFLTNEDASTAVRAEVLAEAGYTARTMRGVWYGDSASVPEPASIWLILPAFALLGAIRWQKRIR